MDDIIIQFEHFGFQYHAQSEPTLHDINLTVRRGETILIAGRGQNSYAEHSAILSDIKCRDAEAAAEHMRQHISGVEQTMHKYQLFQM